MLQRTYLLDVHSSNKGVWGHGQGVMPYSLVTRAHFCRAVIM